MTATTPSDEGRRIVIFGSSRWTSRKLTVDALSRVMRVFQGPYTLVSDMTDGASRYAAAAARELGWRVEQHEFDQSQCGADCPTKNHRRAGGPAGEWCPTARLRNFSRMLDLGADQALLFNFGSQSKSRRDGTNELKDRGIGIWEFVQTPGPVGRKK
jgi:hypothetical protein